MLFGDGKWAQISLRGLIESGYEVVGLAVRAERPDEGLIGIARAMDVKEIFIEKDVNGETFVSKVKSLRPDLNISMSFDQIFKRPIIESAPLGFINCHAGKLPYYRGRCVLLNYA